MNKDDNLLKQQLEERKQRAEERLVIVQRSSGFLEDEEGILEKIFNNLTGK